MFSTGLGADPNIVQRPVRPAMATTHFVRRYSVGVEANRDGSHFRVWAPIRSRVEVVVEGGPTLDLAAESDGYFSGFAEGIHDGTRYRFRLDGGPALFPDPAS